MTGLIVPDTSHQGQGSLTNVKTASERGGNAWVKRNEKRCSGHSALQNWPDFSCCASDADYKMILKKGWGGEVGLQNENYTGAIGSSTFN